MDQVPDLKNDGWEKSSDEPVRTIIHNNITGDSNVVAIGEQISQTVSMDIEKGNIESLTTALRGLGLSSEEAGEFRDAVKEEGPRDRQTGLGPRVTQMLGKLVERSIDLASTPSAGLVSKAIASFYGW